MPEPKYTINSGDIMIEFTAPEDRIIRSASVRVNEKVNEKEQEILSLLLEDPGYIFAQLADQLKVSRKTIASWMKKLKEKEVVERVGAAKNGYWKLK